MIAAERCTLTGRLTSVSLAVAPGELVALVGPNGAGKSSLLALLSGELRPTEGRVTLDGAPLCAMDRRDLARRRAVVRQAPMAPFPLTVREAVALGRLPHGDERHDRGAVSRAAAALGLTPLLDRSLLTLSGGERQRAQIARAFAQIDGVPSPLLLLDEPSSAADLGWQERILADLSARAAAGAAVVVVLHDLNLAARWARRIVVLHEGRIFTVATSDLALSGPLLSHAWGLRFDLGVAAGRPFLVPTLESP